MYLGDPREMAIRPESGITLEADNRKEEMYHWGAQILDLCGMSPEDYKNSTTVTVKGDVVCSGCSGGSGSGGTTPETNKGTCTIDGNVFTMEFQKAVESTIYAFITAKDKVGTEFKFEVVVPSGSKSGEYEIEDHTGPFSIYSVKVNFEDDEATAADEAEDDKYKYVPEYSGDIVGKTYVLSIIHSLAKTLTDDDFADIITGELTSSGIATNGEVVFPEGDYSEDFKMTVKCMHVSAYMADDEKFREENSFDFFIFTQHQIADIEDYISSDLENWELSTVSIKGSSFNKAFRRDPDSQCKWATDPTASDNILTYTLTISKQ